MLTKSMSKYHKVGLTLCALIVVLYVVRFIVKARPGISVSEILDDYKSAGTRKVINGLNNKATEFGRSRFCNESIHSVLPNDTIIDQMALDNLYTTFSRYATRHQINCCKMIRAGSTSTFGKNICLDCFQNVRNTCLVYSFGSQFHFEFENSMWKNYKCEIHTFDPSHSTNGVQIPEGINFHLTGLSDSDTTITAPKSLKDFTNWTMKTLSSIRKSLNHDKREIDVLKIDIEGWEWRVIPDAIRSRDLKYVKQLCLELHFGIKFENVWSGNRVVNYRYVNGTWGDVTIQNQLKALRHLYEQGFRIFKSEPLQGWGIYPLRVARESADMYAKDKHVLLLLDNDTSHAKKKTKRLCNVTYEREISTNHQPLDQVKPEATSETCFVPDKTSNTNSAMLMTTEATKAFQLHILDNYSQVIHGVNNFATDFKGKDRQCNESIHSDLPNDTIIEQMDIDNLYDTIFSLSTNGVQIPEGVNIHLTGLSDINATMKAPKSMKDFSNWTTLSTIRKSLTMERFYLMIFLRFILS